MADKIDSLKIGSTSYDIDLPPDATPSIASLTTSGAITANGGTTTNGLVVKNSTGQTATFTVTNPYEQVGSLSLSGVDYLSASNIQATFMSVGCNAAYITQLGNSDTSLYTYLDQNFTFKTNESGESGRGQATYGVKIPNTYGWTANRTLATTNDIPTVNNGTLTIQKNGSNVQTFTANQSGNVTANITVPTKVSELTNDSGFTSVTESTVSGWGFTKNAGTVTSVCNVSPSSGNVALTHANIGAGNLTVGSGNYYLNMRGGHDSYNGGIYYSTPGNEAIVFANKNSVTSWIFATTNVTGMANWTTLSPSMQIKNGKVVINKLIADGENAAYNLDVNGTLNATTIYENGTSLVSKYLGLSAKAADADKLDGNDSTYYLNYNNLTNKPTIPATNVIPATTTANKILVSTTTSGTAKWSDWSSAGFLKTNTSGVISVDTNSYYLSSNPNGYTSNTGTVTSVSAGTGLSISGTASTTPTVNVASGYKLPTTTEWNGKQNALPTTTTAGKVLKSTSTAGTVEWSDDTNTNQTVKGNGTAFSANDAIDIVGAGTVTVTADTTNKKITITGSAHTTDHNQTVKGNGTAFGADAAVNIVGGGATTVTADTTNNKITISTPSVTDTNQKVKAGSVTFGNNDVVDIVAGSNVTVTGLASGTGAPKITIAATDTGATSVETTGSGNAVSSASYDASTRKITLTKGVTALTSHQSIKTLKTDNTTAQTTSSSEAIAGSGTINLHKVAKTGTYSDLIGTPTIPTTYLKSASVSGNKLTLTPASGTATTFTPYNQTVAANGAFFPVNREVNFVGKDGITVAADGSVANQINISGSYPTPEIIDISGGITQAIKNKVTAKPLSFLQDSNGYLYYPSYNSGIPNCYESFDTESCESKALSIDWTNLTVDTSTETYATNNSVQSKTYIHNLTITPTSTSQAHTLYLKLINRTSTSLTKANLSLLSKSNSLQPRTVDCGILNSSNNFYPARLVSTSYSGSAPTFTILVNGQSSNWTLTLLSVTDTVVQL